MEVIHRPPELHWLKAIAYAVGYLAACSAISVLPWMAFVDAFLFLLEIIPKTAAKPVALAFTLLLVAIIFLSGLAIAWKVHRSRGISVLFILFAIPAGSLSMGVAAALLLAIYAGDSRKANSPMPRDPPSAALVCQL